MLKYIPDIKFLSHLFSSPFLLVLILSIPAWAQWSLVKNLPPRITIRAAAFVSDNTLLFKADSAQMIKTTDFGQNWSYNPSQTGFFAKTMHFFTPLIGIAAGDLGYFYKSSDGGLTWSAQTIASGISFTEMKTLNDSTYVLFSAGSSQFYKTTNAGINWTSASLPAAFTEKHKVSLLSINNILYVNGSNVYRTSNSGASWSFITFAGSITPLGIHFLSPSLALIYSSQGRVYTSADSGRSWFFKSFAPHDITHSLFFNQNQGIFLTASGHLYKTFNSAASFDSVRLPETAGAASILFSRSMDRIGFATHNWQIYISSNQGSLWHEHIAAMRLVINAVDCSNNSNSFITVGDYGRMYSIQNLTATVVFSSTNQHLRAIARGGGTRGIVVGDSGTILHRFPSATIWSVAHIPYRANLKGAAYNHAEASGYAVGERGIVLFSDNAGQNWSLRRADIFSRNLNAVTMKDRSSAIAVGDSGIVIKTTNEGLTWEQTTLGTGKNFLAISGNNDNVLVTGADGTIYRSTNFGTSWYPSMINTTADIVSVNHFSGPSAVTATKTGHLYVTSNNGQSWNYESTFSNKEITGLSFFNYYTGAVTTRDGFVLFRNSIIPVELLSFQIQEQDGKIIVNWSTATETNNLGFEVQKSRDRDTWQSVGFVRGNGTSTVPAEYSYTDNYPEEGLSYYRLVQKDFDGTNKIFADKEIYIAGGFSLAQNYPNPFNPTTQISYSIPADMNVELKVFNSLGSEVFTVPYGIQPKGTHRITLDAEKLPSGVYFYTIKTPIRTFTRKMMVIK